MPESKGRRSGNPAKRARQEALRTPAGRARRDLIEVSTLKSRGLIVLDVGGEPTGMTVETTDALIVSLTNARNEVAGVTANPLGAPK